MPTGCNGVKLHRTDNQSVPTRHPMTLHTWLIYLSLVVVATATPGPAVLFIVTSSTLHGWRRSVFAALGNISGLFCLGILTVAGLGTMLKTSEGLFNSVKYIGAAYLIYLGLRLILQKKNSITPAAHQVHAENTGIAKIFLQAFGVAMSNPKAIVFLTALFPQFIDITQPLIPQFLILITTLMTMSFSFLMLYAILAHRARIWLAEPNRISTFNRASGTLFIGFGALLAASSRN